MLAGQSSECGAEKDERDEKDEGKGGERRSVIAGLRFERRLQKSSARVLFAVPIPLTPALSQRERENLRQCFHKRDEKDQNDKGKGGASRRVASLSDLGIPGFGVVRIWCVGVGRAVVGSAGQRGADRRGRSHPLYI